MANIKWSGIESSKYGLTATWYVSAYYGSDTDDDSVGDYDASTNTTGHGGPTRPFATLDKMWETATATNVVVIDSGYYSYNGTSVVAGVSLVGDGIVIISTHVKEALIKCYNLNIVNSNILNQRGQVTDCNVLYSTINKEDDNIDSNSNFIECVFSLNSSSTIVGVYQNCNFINCSGEVGMSTESASRTNNFFVGCSSLTFYLDSIRPTGCITDYSVIIGTVKTNISINGKTTGVTVEDFKTDGNYFLKSYSEVDLFGNTEGDGATTVQLNTIFNNYYSPIYVDDYHNLDLTLLADTDEQVRFGGLSGTYIGALPVGYRLSAYDLWNTYVDSTNTTGLEYDTINEAIVLEDDEDVGTFTSTEIDLGDAISVDLVTLFANFVYNSDGTAKQGVANQRIDTDTDLTPDNTANQRVVYDYRIKYAEDATSDVSTEWINLELNRQPSEDASGYYQLEDDYDSDTSVKLTIRRLLIEFTLRRIIID